MVGRKREGRDEGVRERTHMYMYLSPSLPSVFSKVSQEAICTSSCGLWERRERRLREIQDQLCFKQREGAPVSPHSLNTRCTYM